LNMIKCKIEGATLTTPALSKFHITVLTNVNVMYL
jgi:hypothetical protein